MQGLFGSYFKGSADPMQGWVSYDYAVKVEASALQYSKTDHQGTTLATLLVPFQDKVPDVTVKVINKTQYEITCNDATFIIVLGDGTLQTVGDFEFDGDMLSAEFDQNGEMIECFAAKASLIKYQGQKLLDSMVRHKIDSSSIIKL